MAKYSCSIVGANGYLGRHLCVLLHSRGYKVNAYGKSDERNKAIPSDLSYQKIDITDKENVKQINLDVDFVFIFSGLTGTQVGFERYEEFIQVNEIGFLNILNEISQVSRKPQVIFPSTRLVYKGASLPLSENDTKETKTIYAANKLNCEHLLQAYSNYFSFPYSIFRLCVPYGNLFDDNFSYGTVGYFINKASNNESIVLFGDGSLQRTFTHVESFCNQLVNAIEKEASKNEIFNVAGETLSLLEAATIVAKKYNVNVEFIEWPNADLKLESGDTVFNSEKINSLIGFREERSFENWIKSL